MKNDGRDLVRLPVHHRLSKIGGAECISAVIPSALLTLE